MQQEDYELISAYLDDELDQQARSQVEERLATDDEFAQAFATFDTQNTQIKSMYTEIDNKPVPDELQALLAEKPPTVSEEHEQTVIRPPVSVWKKWMPLAASFAVAAVLIPFLFDQQRSDVMTIAEVLDTRSSGETIAISDSDNVFLSMSFDDASGDWCREYYIATGAIQQHRIACRKNNEWESVIEVDAPFPNANVFSPASGGTAEIDAWLDENMATDSLTKEQEKARLHK